MANRESLPTEPARAAHRGKPAKSNHFKIGLMRFWCLDALVGLLALPHSSKMLFGEGSA
jgi:hypothetical protein